MGLLENFNLKGQSTKTNLKEKYLKGIVNKIELNETCQQKISQRVCKYKIS